MAATTTGTTPGAKGSDTTFDATQFDAEKQDQLNDATSASSEHSRQHAMPYSDVEKAVAQPDAKAGPAAPAPARPAWMDPASFPDGGLQAWLCVLGAFCALFVSFGTALHSLDRSLGY